MNCFPHSKTLTNPCLTHGRPVERIPAEIAALVRDASHTCAYVAHSKQRVKRGADRGTVKAWSNNIPHCPPGNQPKVWAAHRLPDAHCKATQLPHLPHTQIHRQSKGLEAASSQPWLATELQQHRAHQPQSHVHYSKAAHLLQLRVCTQHSAASLQSAADAFRSVGSIASLTCWQTGHAV